jgi:hypothetical protein
MGFRGTLVFAALIAGAAAVSSAAAQEFNFDPKSLSAPTGAAAAHKGKTPVAKQHSGAAGGSEKPAKVDNRQFGELEGWSPGKTLPKKKEEETGSRFSGSAPVSIGPSGNMNVGVPF